MYLYICIICDCVSYIYMQLSLIMYMLPCEELHPMTSSRLMNQFVYLPVFMTCPFPSSRKQSKERDINTYYYRFVIGV